jgi:hypothetical protein
MQPMDILSPDTKIRTIEVCRFNSSAILQSCASQSPSMLQGKEDTHWGVVINGTLVHVVGKPKWVVEIEKFQHDSSVRLTSKCHVQKDVTWENFLQDFHHSEGLRTCHDYCVEVYNFFGFKLLNGWKEVIQKSVAVAEAGACVTVCVAGALILSGPLGWTAMAVGAVIGYDAITRWPDGTPKKSQQ